MSQIKKIIISEQNHAQTIINAKESNWGWHTAAGKIRKQRRLNFLLQGLDPGDFTLELGCGTGTFTQDLEDNLKNLISMDISLDLLSIALKKTMKTIFLQMDAHNISFSNNSLEAVIGCSILHHLDVKEALYSIYRILKPGGVIRFSEPNLLNPQIFLQKKVPVFKKLAGDSPDESAFTKSSISKDLADAGFADIIIRPFEFLHPHTPRPLMGLILSLENSLHKTLMRNIGGSLLISARKPEGRNLNR